MSMRMRVNPSYVFARGVPSSFHDSVSGGELYAEEGCSVPLRAVGVGIAVADDELEVSWSIGEEEVVGRRRTTMQGSSR